MHPSESIPKADPCDSISWISLERIRSINPGINTNIILASYVSTVIDIHVGFSYSLLKLYRNVEILGRNISRIHVGFSVVTVQIFPKSRGLGWNILFFESSNIKNRIFSTKTPRISGDNWDVKKTGGQLSIGRLNEGLEDIVSHLWKKSVFQAECSLNHK